MQNFHAVVIFWYILEQPVISTRLYSYVLNFYVGHYFLAQIFD